MEIDNRKLEGADDEQLRRAVREAALAAGAGEVRARILSRDVEKVRQMLASLTKEDVVSLTEAIGEERLKEIIDGIGGGAK